MGASRWRPPLRRYALSDDQFARIEHLLPGRPGHVGRNSDKGSRLFVEAVIYHLGESAVPYPGAGYYTVSLAPIPLLLVGAALALYVHHRARSSSGTGSGEVEWALNTFEKMLD